ncbi:MAG TPA: MFS transporter [Rhodocyclaceae bacterium]|nr:MFS transporter [Rhodocyclaceae bacterium]
MSSSRRTQHFGPAHRWKVLAVGVVANASFAVAFSGLPITSVFIRAGYHLDNATLGWVIGLMGLGIAISELPWGLLTDRWGDRPVLLTGLISTAAALALMALFAAPTPDTVPPTWLLAVGLLSVGLLGGSVNGASGRAVMAWFQSGERGFAMSVRQTAVPLGGGIGALVLPALAVHAGFAVIYWVLAAGCAAAALLTWLWLHEVPGAHGGQVSAKAAEGVGASVSPLRNGRVWMLVAATGILCAPQFAVLSFGSVFLHDFAGAGVGVISSAMVSLQIGAMAMRVWSGHWTDRRRSRPFYLRACASLTVVLFIAQALFALFAGSAGTLSPVVAWGLVALLAISGICVSAWHGVAYTELATAAGASRAGTALGMANTSVFAVCFITPFSIPYLLAWQGWPLVWLAASAAAFVALMLFKESEVSQAAPESLRALPVPLVPTLQESPQRASSG